MSVAMTRGVLFVHSAPTALCPHVEWAIGSVVDKRTDLEWTAQPAAPGMFRAELSWTGTPGTGAQLASALRGWAHLRYEVTEEPSQGVDGGRWSHTPELGIFHAVTDVHGNIMVPRTASATPTNPAPAIPPPSTTSSRWPSARPGTRSSSPSATLPKARPCAGCTRWARPPADLTAGTPQQSP